MCVLRRVALRLPAFLLTDPGLFLLSGFWATLQDDLTNCDRGRRVVVVVVVMVGRGRETSGLVLDL